MTNEELVIRIKAGIDTADNMAMLWQQNLRFIESLARRYSHLAEMEDLAQEGYFGLCEAVERYSPNKGVKFLTYAGHWIRQKMARYTHNNGSVHISEHTQCQLMEYKKLSNAFLLQVGREPTDKEISLYMGIRLNQVRQLKKDTGITQIVSLDSPIEGVEDITLGDSITGHEDIEGRVLDAVEAEQLKATIWPIVDTLPGQQPEVIRARYQDNMTLDAIGRQQKITREAVRQIESKALRGLRKSSRSKQLRPFIEDYIQTHAYHGGSAQSFNRTWTSSTEWTAIKLIEMGESCH